MPIPDPNAALIGRLRDAERMARRAAAHARIDASRLAINVDALLSELQSLQLRIEVAPDLLREVLRSYPEDE